VRGFSKNFSLANNFTLSEQCWWYVEKHETNFLVQKITTGFACERHCFDLRIIASVFYILGVSQ